MKGYNLQGSRDVVGRGTEEVEVVLHEGLQRSKDGEGEGLTKWRWCYMKGYCSAHDWE